MELKVMSVKDACQVLNQEGYTPPVRPNDLHYAVRLGEVTRPLEIGPKLWLVDQKHLAEMRAYLAKGIRRGPRKPKQLS